MDKQICVQKPLFRKLWQSYSKQHWTILTDTLHIKLKKEIPTIIFSCFRICVSGCPTWSPRLIWLYAAQFVYCWHPLFCKNVGFSPYWIKHNATSPCFRGVVYNSGCPYSVEGRNILVLKIFKISAHCKILLNLDKY